MERGVRGTANIEGEAEPVSPRRRIGEVDLGGFAGDEFIDQLSECAMEKSAVMRSGSANKGANEKRESAGAQEDGARIRCGHRSSVRVNRRVRGRELEGS